MISDSSNNSFDPQSNEEVKKPAESSALWPKLKYYLNIKRVAIKSYREKSVYIETLSMKSIKRSYCRLYKRVFKSNHCGYERLLTEEEKRFSCSIDKYSIVEGAYRVA